jgi:hypothetical protein
MRLPGIRGLFLSCSSIFVKLRSGYSASSRKRMLYKIYSKYVSSLCHMQLFSAIPSVGVEKVIVFSGVLRLMRAWGTRGVLLSPS